MATPAAAVATPSAFPRPSPVPSFKFPSLTSPLHRHCRRRGNSLSLLAHHRRALSSLPAASLRTSLDQVEENKGSDESWGFSEDTFEFDLGSAVSEMKRVIAPDELQVKELEELPEQWRRTKLAWLCKELPAHKAGTLTRILNAQRKWMRQEDGTYVAVHCMRIRENETGFKVYKWMMQQHWYRFDFALATKLADYLGKQRKFAKCREIFDDIINQGRVPSESTFHVLIVAYLSSSVQGSLEDACDIYNRMIQLGGYLPQLSLHNALFRALVSGPGGSSKHHLKQAEFIFHNLVTYGLDTHKDVYGGLIWLHSYQDVIDTERIRTLRKEMAEAGFKEGRDVVLSILRASSKVGDTKEAERAWSKLLHLGITMPPLAYVYKMEVYAKVGQYMKSLDIFSQMKQNLGSPTVAAYHQIIEVLCKAQNVDLAESLMIEFMESDLKPLRPSYIDLMNMYFVLKLHDKVESAFQQCLEKCQPDRTVFGIYLDSLVQVSNIDKAEEIFNLMQGNVAVGVSKRSCNSILGGYLSSGDDSKAEKTYHFMCQKKYDVEPLLMEKLNEITSARAKPIKKPPSPKLSKEQREILVGMLLGGLQIESDERRKKHIVRFQFNENSNMHYVLKKHIYEQFHEWLDPSSRLHDCCSDEIPNRFLTVEHTYFGFYAEQFWPNGEPMIPKLIHRWLSPFVLAYWYMYGGHKTEKGDVALKLRGRKEGVEAVVKCLKAKSVDCRVKKKGRVFWIGLLGDNSTLFRNLIEPYVLDGGNNMQVDGDINFSGDTDDYSDSDRQIKELQNTVN